MFFGGDPGCSLFLRFSRRAVGRTPLAEGLDHCRCCVDLAAVAPVLVDLGIQLHVIQELTQSIMDGRQLAEMSASFSK